MRTNEVKTEKYEITKWEEEIKPKNLKYKTKKYTYDFQQFGTKRSLVESIYSIKAGLVKAEQKQGNLLESSV